MAFRCFVVIAEWQANAARAIYAIASADQLGAVAATAERLAHATSAVAHRLRRAPAAIQDAISGTENTNNGPCRHHRPIDPKGATSQDLERCADACSSSAESNSPAKSQSTCNRSVMACCWMAARTPCTAAEAALTAGRDTVDKIGSVVLQLKSRLAAAEEAETVARVKALLAQFQAT